MRNLIKTTTRLAFLLPLSSISFVTIASAQVRFSVAGFAATPQNTVLFLANEEAATGTWTGFEVALRAGPLSLTAIGMTGPLNDKGTNPAVLDRDGGEMGGTARLFILPWFGIGGGYSLRRYTSVVGVQDWTVPSAGATLVGADGGALTSVVNEVGTDQGLHAPKLSRCLTRHASVRA